MEQIFVVKVVYSTGEGGEKFFKTVAGLYNFLNKSLNNPEIIGVAYAKIGVED